MDLTAVGEPGGATASRLDKYEGETRTHQLIYRFWNDCKKSLDFLS